jgi:ABC-type Na+ efflux pump permease subunit
MSDSVSQVSAASRAAAHKLFSIGRVFAIAGNTFRDLVRQKVFYFMLVFALILIGASLALVTLSFQGQLQTVMDVSLGAISVFTMLLAVLSTAMLLPKDMEDRTLYTILAKPVARFEYLLGKLIGVSLILTVAVLLMSIVFCGVLWFWQGREVDAMQLNYPTDRAAQEIAKLRSVQSARVGVVGGDVLEHVARVARFGSGFNLVDERAHLLFVARLRRARGEHDHGEENQ